MTRHHASIESPSPELVNTYLLCALAANNYDRFVKFLKEMRLPLYWKSAHFTELWPKVGVLSLLDPFRADMLLSQLELSLHQPGDVAEFGVFRGGTAMLCALLMQRLGIKKKIHLFDSFQGLPEPNRKYDAGYTGGNMRSSESNLRTLITRLGVEEFCIIHPGWFEESVAQLETSQKFCFVHIDCDLYESAKIALHVAFPKLVAGGLIALDDYYDASGGVHRAVQELLVEYPADILIGPAPQAFLRKNALPDPEPSYDLLKGYESYIAYIRAFASLFSGSAEVLSSFCGHFDDIPFSTPQPYTSEQLLSRLRILLT
jgi:hypothetical protein